MFSPSEWFSKPRLVCGIMTGTSLDAIDVSLAEFTLTSSGRHSLRILSTYEAPLPFEIRTLIKTLMEENISIRDVARLNALLPLLFEEAVIECSARADVRFSSLDAIGIHGQTVWHEPVRSKMAGYDVATTLQLGSPSILASLLDVPVVGDFRSADVALGGQGAPLVPIFDFNFLSKPGRDRIALNVGGMANLTLLPANVTENTLRAFDTGPGNVLIDTSTQIFFGKSFDTNGSMARDGVTIPSMLTALKQIDFIRQPPPKSTGRELFTTQLVRDLVDRYHQPLLPFEDIVRTFTEFTAWSIAENIRLFGMPHAEIIVSGGGAKNSTLIELLEMELPRATITTSDDIGISGDFKEAICFAYLAFRTMGGLHSNVPSVTGAYRKQTLGVVAFPLRK